MTTMTDKKPLYKLCPADTFSFIPLSAVFAAFGGVTLWLYLRDNGIMFFTGIIAILLLGVIIYSVYCQVFVKMLVYEDGFYYRKGFSQGKFYSYSEISEASESQKHNPNGSTSWCFHFTTADGQQFSFTCPMNQTDGIDYMLDKING